MATLVSVTCPFNAGQWCEAKFIIDGLQGLEGDMRLRISPEQAEMLKCGDVYGNHIRRL